MTTLSDELPSGRWTPVLNGVTYCSPACGAGCTVAQYENARREAEEMAHRLNRKLGTTGWQARVWENLGWHGKAQKISKALGTTIEVHANRGRRNDHPGYSAYITAGSFQCGGADHTPEEAVLRALKMLDEHAEIIRKAALFIRVGE